MRRFILLSVLILFSAGSLYAQILPVPLGPVQNPSSVYWKKIDTLHFQIIFPQQIERDARYVANYMEYIYPYVHKTAGAIEKKTPIFLFTDYAVSNGYSTIAPRYSAWFSTPMQDFLGTSDGWYETLGLHEYRHILQFDSLDHGTIGGLKYLLGDYGLAIGMGLSIPAWYFEGEAVVTETVLSDSGRGRSPAFDGELRALLLSGNRYGFYKALMGSYDDYDPLSSPYLMGYFLSSKLRRDYGDDILTKINNETSWIPLPYRHTHAVHQYTGKHTSDQYEDVMNELTRLWSNQIEGLTFSQANDIENNNRGRWRSAKHPRYADNSVIALRNMYSENAGIVEIDRTSGREYHLASADPIDDTISVGGNHVVWSQNVPDVRWGMRSYADIYTFDLITGSERRLTYKQKFFAPAISPDGSKIVAVEFDNANRCSLMFVDSLSGEIVKRIESPDNEFIQNPSWSTDGTSIVYESLHHVKGNALRICDAEGGKSVMIVPYSHEGVKNPSSDGRFIYYSSSYSGIDAIYAVDIKSKKQFQVISRKFGAYTPTVSSDGKRILFSDLTARGYVVEESTVDQALWIPIEKVPVRKVVYCEPLIKQEAGKSIVTEDIPQKDYASTDYWGFERVFAIHSWYPYYSPTRKDLGLVLLSTNPLSTLNGSAGYFYNYNENTHAGVIKLSYAGLYPIFDITGKYGRRAESHIERSGNVKETVFDSWMEKTARGTVRLPFNFSRGLFYRGIDLSAGIGYTEKSDVDYITKANRHKNNNGVFIPVTYTFSAYNYMPVYGYIYPEWGQILSLFYTDTPIKKGDYQGKMLSSDLLLFLPGIFNRCSLSLEGAYERQLFSKNNYWYESQILFPRGYKAVSHENFAKGSVTYTFPLFYPDHNVLWLAYLKRIYVNAFYDYGLGITQGERYKYRSIGGELMFEWYVLNISGGPGVHIGYRRAYAFDAEKKKRNTAAIVIGISGSIY